jgi:hypothetical protein
MMQKKIKEIWDAIVFEESDKGDTAWHRVRERASAEVAKLVEEEISSYKATIEELQADEGHLAEVLAARNDMMQKNLDRKQAQLAEMREALTLTDALIDAAYDSGYYAGAAYQRGEPIKSDYETLAKPVIQKRNQLSKKMKKALAAAPEEVLWSGEGRWDASEEELGTGYITLVLRGISEISDGKKLGIALASQELDDRDGQQVKVIVLAGRKSEGIPREAN